MVTVDSAVASRTWIDDFWRPELPAPPAQGPVAFGGVLTPADLLAAHTNGLLPMPCDTAEDADVNECLYGGSGIRMYANSYELAWWSPDPRPVLTFAGLRIGAGLTKTLTACAHWTTTVDRDFTGVLEGCRAGREPRWLTDPLAEAMIELHGQGWYHSLEVWSGADIVGGALGLGRGLVFSADMLL